MLESVEIAAKFHVKKVINEKVTEKWSFLLQLLCAKAFVLQIFLSDFLLFFQRIQTQHQILRFMIPIYYF